jgi:hypothetical protein
MVATYLGEAPDMNRLFAHTDIAHAQAGPFQNCGTRFFGLAVSKWQVILLLRNHCEW